MSIEWVTILLFGGMLLLLPTGLPIVFILGGFSIVVAFFLWGPESLTMVLFGVKSVMGYGVLVAIPLFVFMGMILSRSGIIDAFYAAMLNWFGFLPGSLAMVTVGVCTVMAAMVGEVTPATLTMGTIALPAMLKKGYDKEIAIGCVQAGAALGFLIPPSVIAILYAVIAKQSIGQFFAGGLVPGLILAVMIIAYIGVRSAIQPRIAPRVHPEEMASWKEKFVSLRAVIFPVVIVIAVLGSILLGVATPVEASAVGAFATLIGAAITRKFSWSIIKDATSMTLRLTSIAMWIFVAALAFGKIYGALGASELLEKTLNVLNVGPWGTLIIMQLSYFLLGMILDDTAILFICLPIYIPIATHLGFNPLWFGILYIVNMQMAYLTPPFGYCLFLIKSVVPKDITMGDIYRSVWPFVIIQGACLALCMVFPEIVLWFPKLLFGLR